MATIETPVKGYTGTVAGVEFQDGRAETDNSNAISYFRRHGYTVDGETRQIEQPEPADPREVEPVVLGELRDAAVDPHDDDYLPPTNAGDDNPHGPRVVSPQVHGDEPHKGIVPGDHSDAHESEAKETEATKQALFTVDDDGRPNKSANKPEWVAWAVANGADQEQASEMTKDDLIEKYG